MSRLRVNLADALPMRKKDVGTQCSEGWLVPRAGMNGMEKRKSPSLCRISKHDS